MEALWQPVGVRSDFVDCVEVKGKIPQCGLWEFYSIGIASLRLC